MLLIWFKLVEFAFEYFKSLSNVSYLHLNASNLFQMFQICIRMPQMPFKRLEFSFESFEFDSNR